MPSLISHFSRLRADTKAVTAIEYALMAAIVSMAVITGAVTLGGNLSSTYLTIDSAFFGTQPVGASAASTASTGGKASPASPAAPPGSNPCGSGGQPACGGNANNGKAQLTAGVSN